ncbi:hypothetical protein [Proteiniphilum saccharofermentans]|nr:hypothetical protein [Proteiniphilum saccharofermentans]
MMTTDIEMLDEKLALIQWISTVDDFSVIERIKKIREEETEDWWNSISVEEKESIEKGIIDADNGNVVQHSEVRKLYEKWL